MAKTITIAFLHGGILPAEVTGKDEVKVKPHEPVSVPESYGNQLINDRFAVLAKPIAKEKSQAKQSTAPAGTSLAELGRLVGEAKAALDSATDENRAEMQVAFDEAKANLQAAKEK
ncbi:hypothetical protein KQ944_17995 [Bacillus subtilis]|uniref:hypothetical protein n=1 Tax=Pseudochrobactrum asaccharolyticum TaxID=354351 RepID=UPI001F24EAF5|nr:hypothetical protein [Pseudochrobactrum asaccharolyticum]MCF7646889.1 hypothetical protein [Pseudochrobactrum asaccharolyticum]MCF7673531.1 hypothetical protein [Bacillus subtilis]